MKTILLTGILLLAPVFALAGCVMTETVLVFSDMEHLMAFYRVGVIAGRKSAQYDDILQKFKDSGDALIVKAKTPIDKVERINNSVSWVTIKGARVVSANEAIGCD